MSILKVYHKLRLKSISLLKLSRVFKAFLRTNETMPEVKPLCLRKTTSDSAKLLKVFDKTELPTANRV